MDTEIKEKSKSLPVLSEKDRELSDAVVSMIEAKAVNNKDKFFLYLHFTDSILSAAKLASISPSYAYKLSSRYKIDASLQKRVADVSKLVPAKYKQAHILALPKVFRIKLKALEEMETDPKLAIRNPILLRDIERQAGLDVEPEAKQTINIDKMMVLVKESMNVDHNDTVQEAEIIRDQE